MNAGRRRVLVVEDDRSLRRVVQLNLALRGYEVETAASGADAIPLVALHPDLVVLDLGLPDADGVGVVTRLRALGTTDILVMSSLDRRTAAEEAKAAGAVDYLAKPFSAEELAAKVRSILSRPYPAGGGAPWTGPEGMSHLPT